MSICVSWGGLKGLLAGAVLLFAPLLDAQAQMRLPPEPRLAPDKTLEIFSDKLDRAVKTGDFVGLAVAVVKDGDIALLRTYGKRAVNAPDPITPSTRFRIASLSKGFAAGLAAQLADKHQLDLEAPVKPYAPGFRLARSDEAEKVTIAHILSHRTGLPPYAYDNLLEANVPVPTIFDRLSRVKMICPVGRCYSYQNVAYSLIEPVVASISGEPFERAVANHLFKPLGMKASYGMSAFQSDDNWARPHVRGRSGWRVAPPDEMYYHVPSAGGVNASIEDMARWLQAQMGTMPDVLSPNALALMQTPRVRTRAELRRVRWLKNRVTDAHYALGWRIYEYAGRSIVMHNGGLQGYRAQIAFLPEKGLGVVALWNSMSSRGWAMMPTLFDAYFRLEDEDWLRLDCTQDQRGTRRVSCASD